MAMDMYSLQNLSLEAIVSNFRRYCRGSITEDSCLKLKYIFLRKKFSFHILQKLNKENRLKAEYLDFLITKYLKVLDTQWLANWPWETVSQKFAEIGHNLEEVTFTLFDRRWEDVLCYLPNLKSVSFQHFCTDEFLLSLSKFCKCVETLDVKYSDEVSDNGLMHLCCKDNDKNLLSFNAPIKELLVQFTNVGDEGIVYVLNNMPSLEEIDYGKLPEALYSMHKSHINALHKVKPYNLTHLDLMFVDADILADVFTVCVSLCPHLKSLSSPILQEHHLDLCSQLQELEKLQLHCWKEVPLDLNAMLTLNGKKLSLLIINNFRISFFYLNRNCPRLQLLKLNNAIAQFKRNGSEEEEVFNMAFSFKCWKYEDSNF